MLLWFSVISYARRASREFDKFFFVPSIIYRERDGIDQWSVLVGDFDKTERKPRDNDDWR